MTQYTGIDYSLGQSNVDKQTGIHYGVIAMNSINLDYTGDFEQYYGEPTCPECGNKVIEIPAHTTQLENDVAVTPDIPEKMEEWEQYSKHGCADYACETCQHTLDSSEVFSDESLGFTYEQDGYKLADCLDSDIFVLGSPFYTHAQYCSPCVPGAGNLDTPVDDGPKTYCLGHDWFDDGRAPYKVFRVSDGTEVLPE